MVKRDFFLEKNKYTYTFDGGHFFKIEKKFVSFFILKFFAIQQCINPTNKASSKKTKDKYKYGHLNNKDNTGQKTEFRQGKDVYLKIKVTLFTIIKLKKLNIWQKHQCVLNGII